MGSTSGPGAKRKARTHTESEQLELWSEVCGASRVRKYDNGLNHGSTHLRRAGFSAVRCGGQTSCLGSRSV